LALPPSAPPTVAASAAVASMRRSHCAARSASVSALSLTRRQPRDAPRPPAPSSSEWRCASPPPRRSRAE
jgi:hypothetical protein